MDIVESIKRDKQYSKCKHIVKTWEKEFKTKYSRTPSKFDIKEAPTKIKYAYKKYFQLKSEALENSLSVCDYEEESIGSPEITQRLEEPSELPSSPLEQEIPNLPSGTELEKLLSKTKSNELPVINNSKSLFSNQFSKKLFQNSKFSFRNPRKISLSKSQTDLSQTVSVANANISKEVNTTICKADLSNVRLSNTLDDSIETNSFLTVAHYVNKKVRDLDESWVQRATGISCEYNVKEKNNCSSSVENFGLGNIKVPLEVENVIPNIEEIQHDKHCDFVENSGSEDESSQIGRLKPALKKRKFDNKVIQATKNENRHTDLHEVNSSEEKKSKLLNQTKKEQRRKVKMKNMVDKKEDVPPDVSDYLPFGVEEGILPRHNKVSEILKAVETVNPNVYDDENIGKLEKKIMSGTLNENFVKINIEKKIFVRGKKNICFSKYKKKLWKDKKALHSSMEFPESGQISCFKCGATGHMARYCSAQKSEILLPLQNYDDNDMPTLEDMKKIVSEETKCLTIDEQLKLSVYKPSPVPDSIMKLLSENSVCSEAVQPIYSNYEMDIPEEIQNALKLFKHDSFRPGQKDAIMRILSGMSTLLILSTGGGKSLCYQLPAYVYSQHYRCITLVISPLVSLMEDQVLNMPEFLKAGCLHTNQPPTQRSKILELLKEGEINILLISPEALVSGDTSNGYLGLFKSLPQIAFACIDEVHCVSQWSHNFRPSYLMICRVLREKLNVKCILGLTATASQATINNVISHINIPDGLKGVVTNPTLPDNLCLSVSLEKDKDRALVSLLTSESVRTFNSIIVYCIRRDECERVAAVLRSCLQQPGKVNMEVQSKKRKRMSYIAEAYHAGMSAAQRKKIQKHFMDGTLRIIVATVAFGMGINKTNIRCIIHYNTPSSFESYVQEVGRAGRDGNFAFCHVIMNHKNVDKNELLKHIHANTIDRPTIRRLLQKVFIPCGCNKTESTLNMSNIRCKGHEIGIPIDCTVEELDLQSENISTLLCYIELHPKNYIKVLNNAYTICRISSYSGPQKILEAAKVCPPLAMAYLIESKKDPNATKKSILEFPVIEVAAAIGWESGVTKYQLKNLEWTVENGISKRSQLKVDFSQLGFRIRAPGDLNSSELDGILDDLQNFVQCQEKAMLFQLEESHSTFKKLANGSVETIKFSDESLTEKSNELKSIIRNYFLREDILPSSLVLENRPLDVDTVISDVRALICSYKDCTFTGRSIARIFQGISSPNYPALVWGRTKFWRSHIHEDFYGLVKIATQQIIQMKVL